MRRPKFFAVVLKVFQFLRLTRSHPNVLLAPKNDTEAQTDEQKSPFDDIVPQFSSDYTATASISLDVQQYPCMSSCPDHEDTKI